MLFNVFMIDAVISYNVIVIVYINIILKYVYIPDGVATCTLTFNFGADISKE